ncbi:hypothetical protein [Streptomyces roseolilacinus]|uniref:Uncharacterized protein n=1 Tax=Streptomyces roseolilacinus TaxID=66904 RepID=A0A918AVM4_9ACTN|nr:hypothetical protein [Streptomyces roseolilacinus]GGP89658.1 hypothetical protein GCM10010249_04410 [Streptomyces roseolilacinus]
MAVSKTTRARTVALTTSLLLAGGMYGATSAQALDGCSTISGASGCWSSSRDAFTVRDTAVDGATVRVEYRVDLGAEDVVGRCATRADGVVTQTCAVSGLPEGKAVVWSVSTWKGSVLVQRGPTQYHTS